MYIDCNMGILLFRERCYLLNNDEQNNMIPKTLLISIVCISCFSAVFNTVSAQQIQWQPMQGPYGGGIASVAIAKNGTIYCGDFYCNVYRSTDEGISWTRKPVLSYHQGGVDQIVIDKSGYIYAAIGEVGLFGSSDNGNTWISFGFHSPTLRCIAVDPTDKIYLGNDSGLYRSVNRGKSWEKFSTGISGGAYFIFIDTTNADIYASIGSKLYRANDYSNNWKECGMSSNAFIISTTGVLFSARNWDGCYCSKDKGVTWTKIDNIPGKEGNFRFLLADHGKIILLAPYKRLAFISTNNGDIWIETTFSKNNCWDIVQHPNGDLYLATSISGLLKSNNFGSRWTRTNLSVINVSSIKITSQSEIFVNNDFREIQNSTDHGMTWSVITNSLPAVAEFCVDRNYNGQLFIGAPEGIFRSQDNGMTWDRALDTSAYVHSIAVHYAEYSRRNFIYAGSLKLGVLKSMDEGNHWTTISQFAGVNHIACYDENEIYVSAGKNIYRSTDTGKTWTNISIPNQTFYCYTLKVDRYGNIYAGGYDVGIYISYDRGNHWIEIGFPAVTVDDIVITPVGEIYVIAYYDNIYRSKDIGKHWEKVIDGLPNSRLTSLAIDAQGYIYVGTERYGIYRTVNSVTMIHESPALIPRSVSLSQNYPNPFTASTTIQIRTEENSSFGTPYSAFTLKVYDLLGREVLDLSDQARKNSTVTISCSQLPNSGVYIYRLTFGKQSQTRLMTLLR